MYFVKWRKYSAKREKSNALIIYMQSHLHSMKILLLPTKFEIIIVPSNPKFFQYCYRNIGLFSISPCKVITLNHLSILFGISSLLLFLRLSLKSYCSSNYRDNNSCCSFLLLKAIAKRLPLLFTNAFKSVKERQLLLSQ
jgi:hypothetical protein